MRSKRVVGVKSAWLREINMNVVDSSILPPCAPKTVQAFGMAVLLEVALVGILIFLLAHSKSPQPKIVEPIKITITRESTPPRPVVQPKPIPPKPVIRQVARPRPVPQPTPPEPVPLKTEAPTAFTQPAPLPVPVLPPQQAVPDTTALKAEYADRVRAAVQAAVNYPPAAALMHFSGRVRVEFQLQDGVSSNAYVLKSSGLGMIDHAALQAVNNAQYPAPPEALRGKTVNYQVWVALTLTH